MITIERLQSGGAPMRGEPLPIELANATYALRGRLRDGLETTEHLAAWLRDQRGRLATPLADRDLRGVTRHQLAAARRLRDAVRALAAATVEGRVPPAEQVAALNSLARSAPRWRELHWEDHPHAATRSAAEPVAAAIAEIADAAAALFGGPERALLRACHAPGCVLFFVKDHPRREWCSAACGNRARGARHYARHQRQDQRSR